MENIIEIFAREVTEMQAGDFTSTWHLHASWIQYQASWRASEKCVLNSLDIQYDAKNAILYDLQQSMADVEALIEQMKASQQDYRVVGLVAILSICLGLSFTYLLYTHSYLGYLGGDATTPAQQLLLAMMTQNKIHKIPGLWSCDTLEKYVGASLQIKMHLMQLPVMQKFDSCLVRLLEQLSEALSKQQDQQEQFQHLMQLQERLINSDLQQNLYYVAVRVYQNLINVCANKVRLDKHNINSTSMNNKLTIICNAKELNERQAFLIDECVQVKEGQHVEYKYFNHTIEAKREFIIKKVVSSFLNSNGGTLLIGVTDDLIVKGYNVGNLSDVALVSELQGIVNKIHPCPKYGTQYMITLLPIYNQTGQHLDKKRIIKIEVYDFEHKPNVYSFQLYLEDYCCETICSFYRVQDSSKFLNQKRFKDKILQCNTKYAPQQQQRMNPQRIYEAPSSPQYVEKSRASSLIKTKSPTTEQETNNKRQSSQPKSQPNRYFGKEYLTTRTEKIKYERAPYPPSLPPRSIKKDEQQLQYKQPTQPLMQSAQSTQSTQSQSTQQQQHKQAPLLQSAQSTQSQQPNYDAPLTLFRQPNSTQEIPSPELRQAQETKQQPLPQQQLQLQQRQQQQQQQNFLTFLDDDQQPSNIERSLIMDDEENDLPDTQPEVPIYQPFFNNNNFNNNIIINNINNNPINERKKCLLLRKIHPDCMKLVVETVLALSKKESAKFHSMRATILLRCDTPHQAQHVKKELLEVLNYKALDKKKFLYFTLGVPTNQMDVQKWHPDITQKDIEDMSIEISNRTKLFNFTFVLKRSKCQLTVESLDDQIIIYETLKEMLKIFWCLEDKLEVRVNVQRDALA